jgi:hypothetical protein
MGLPTSGSLVTVRARVSAVGRVVPGEPQGGAPCAVAVTLAVAQEVLVWTIASTFQGYRDWDSHPSVNGKVRRPIWLLLGHWVDTDTIGRARGKYWVEVRR